MEYKMRKRFVLVALMICGFVSGNCQTNYKLHTVFIYAFTRYVQWPEANSSGDFEIAVLGDSPIVEELKVMAQSKKVGGTRTIKVVRINSVSDIKPYHIVFLANSKNSIFPDVLAKVTGQPILLVTEQEGLGSKGSNINFVIRDGKLGFEINQASLSKQNLKVSNEINRLAIQI